MDNDLQVKLGEIESGIQAMGRKSAEEVKTLGATQTETKEALAKLQKQFDALVITANRPGAGAEEKSLGVELKENESIARLVRDGRGRASITIKGGLSALERKTTITNTSISTSGNDSMTSGVLGIDRTPGIVAAARRRLFLRDLLTSIPTTLPSIDYVKVENDVSDAAMQTAQGAALSENALTFATATASVRTLGTWMPASLQILEDFAGLEGFIGSSLRFACRKEEEDQMLTGDNTGQNLHGLVTQATAFDTDLLTLSDGWEYADMI